MDCKEYKRRDSDPMYEPTDEDMDHLENCKACQAELDATLKELEGCDDLVALVLIVTIIEQNSEPSEDLP